MTALEALSPSLDDHSVAPSRPLTSNHFADRAYRTALNPLRNPVKEVMDRSASVEGNTPDARHLQRHPVVDISGVRGARLGAGGLSVGRQRR
jgi:hypothetical protein